MFELSICCSSRITSPVTGLWLRNEGFWASNVCLCEPNLIAGISCALEGLGNTSLRSDVGGGSCGRPCGRLANAAGGTFGIECSSTAGGGGLCPSSILFCWITGSGDAWPSGAAGIIFKSMLCTSPFALSLGSDKMSKPCVSGLKRESFYSASISDVLYRS